MARARNIKPGFFVNDELVELPFETRLLFAGLWTIADREGRLEDRPKKIKMAIFPADYVDVNESLQQLHDAGLIVRYVVEDKGYIEVLKFVQHQNPHLKEAASVIPAPDKHGTKPVLATPLTSYLSSESPSPSKGASGKADPKPADVRTWIDAVASLLGARDARSMSKRKQWETVCKSLIREDRDLSEFLAVVASERDRNKDSPQFLSPDSCLQIIQLNGKSNGNGEKPPPKWKTDQDACEKCDDNGYVLETFPHEVCTHK